LVIFFGTFFEGETVLVVGGFLAHGRYLSLFFVIFFAFIATMLWDQLFFHLGRRYGNKILNLKPKWDIQVRKLLVKIKRNTKKVMFSYRFVYGTRTVMPFAIGISGVSPKRYFFFNFIYTLIWSVGFGVLGYFFGYSLELFLGRIRSHELKIALFIIIVFAVVWPIYRYFMNRLGKIGSAR